MTYWELENKLLATNNFHLVEYYSWFAYNIVTWNRASGCSRDNVIITYEQAMRLQVVIDLKLFKLCLSREHSRSYKEERVERRIVVRAKHKGARTKIKCLLRNNIRDVEEVIANIWSKQQLQRKRYQW